jgi:beta-carotene 3-hydroxylase
MVPLTALTLVIAGFLLMEVAGAVAHRFLLHGPWWPLHRSHHLRPSQMIQAGDLVPVVLAALWLAAGAVGLRWFWPVVWLSAGALLQLALHVAVHDLAIHRRLRWLPLPALDRWERAHEVHHRTLGPPYGVLVVRAPREEPSPRGDPARRRLSAPSGQP